LSYSVQDVVWNWKDTSNNQQTDQNTPAVLRRQAIIQALVMGAVGFVIYQWIGHAVFAKVIWGLAGLVLVLGLLIPAAYRPIHNFGQWLGKMIGLILTNVLLVPLYFLVFFPGALILKIQGRDPMHRKPRDSKYTFWIRRTRESSVESYQRQFLLEDRSARSELRPVEQPAEVQE
jgi:hypothetical protein